MSQNENEKSTTSSILKYTSSTLYSFLFDLPFKNYHDYYKTGIIQKMSKEEKINFMIEKNKERQHKQFFNYFLNIRPNILDDEDVFEYRETLDKMNKYQTVIFLGFFINWSYFTYNFFIKKRLVFKTLLIINGVFFIAYLKNNTTLSKEQDKLFEKYKNTFKREDLVSVMKESYGIDKY